MLGNAPIVMCHVAWPSCIYTRPPEKALEELGVWLNLLFTVPSLAIKGVSKENLWPTNMKST